ncbi:MAG: hypothetical protein CMO40_04895 [Verrucomicrobiaceae bacterium]|nr:hypothetical protein [Verrucomicrobiaceae bacterium]
MKIPSTLALVLFLLVTHLPGEDHDTAKKYPVPRYQVPALMMVTWAEWPKDPDQQDVMAQFIKSNGFNAVECEVNLLEMCRRNGLYARLGAGDLNELHRHATKLKDDKNVFGYFVSDRRRKSSFPAFANIAKGFAQADPNHPTIFINRALWGEYHEFVTTVNPMILDFYHYHWDGRRHPERRFIYLRSICELAAENGIPAMRCVGAGVSLPQLRHTIYTSLAYGVKAFHFWPPWMFSYEKKGDQDVLVDGKIIPRVNLPPLAEVAKDVQPLGPTLVGLRSTGVYHTKPFHPQAPGAADFPEDHWIQASGDHLVLGTFVNSDKQVHLLAVNADISQERDTSLSFRGPLQSVEFLHRQSGSWKEVSLEADGDRRTLPIKLPPGGGNLFRLTQPK